MMDNRRCEENSRKLYKEQSTNGLKIRKRNPVTLEQLFLQQQTNAMALTVLKPNVSVFDGNAMEY
jgi:hypothetical protein